MSKSSLKDLMRDKREGNHFFSAIKQEWSRRDLERAEKYVWSKHVNPSARWFTFDGCPHKGLREASVKKEESKPDWQQKAQVGNYLHSMFQDAAKTIPGLLWDKNSIEVSFYLERFYLSGRADLILNIEGEPVLGEIKIPQRPEGWPWDTYMKTLPEDGHLVQAISCAYGINELNLIDKPINKVAILYFHPGVINGFKEYHRDITPEMLDKVKLLLEHSKMELDNILAGKDDPCSYPLCKEHAK